MSDGGVTVRRVEETARAMRALSPGIRAKIDGALDKGAGEVRDLAKRIAPRDSGDLADAIEVRGSVGGGGAGALSVFAATAAGLAEQGLARYIGVFPERRGSKGWYARWVEFGTRARRATPFLRPAFQVLRRRVQGRVKRAITAGIKEVARRGR